MSGELPALSITAGCLPEAWEKAVLAEVPRDEMVDKDREELLAEPSAKDLTSQSAQPESPAAGEEARPEAPAQTQPAQAVERAKEAEPTTFYFTTLDETDQIAAEGLLAVIPTGRSIGRLPMTGYNLMVETCRQIMERWPGSIICF
jgi:hypothetical protein